MSSQLVIETRDLRKSYGARDAVRGLTFGVPRGSICGFLGRNGAGKTTTFKMLMGMTRPSGGQAHVLGQRVDDEDEARQIRQRTGFVSEDKLFPRSITVGELLQYTRSFYPGWRGDLEERCLEAFGLRRGAIAGLLSKGARSGLALALALPRGAELLLLDEPTEGLDPALTEQALSALVALAAEEGTTVFFSTHQLALVEQIADRVCLIDEGRVVVDDSIDELRAGYRRVSLVFEAEPPASGFEGARRDGRTLSLLVRRELDEVVARAKALHARSVDVQPVTLKEIVLECARGGRR